MLVFSGQRSPRTRRIDLRIGTRLVCSTRLPGKSMTPLRSDPQADPRSGHTVDHIRAGVQPKRIRRRSERDPQRIRRLIHSEVHKVWKSSRLVRGWGGFAGPSGAPGRRRWGSRASKRESGRRAGTDVPHRFPGRTRIDSPRGGAAGATTRYPGVRMAPSVRRGASMRGGAARESGRRARDTRWRAAFPRCGGATPSVRGTAKPAGAVARSRASRREGESRSFRRDGAVGLSG